MLIFSHIFSSPVKFRIVSLDSNFLPRNQVVGLIQFTWGKKFKIFLYIFYYYFIIRFFFEYIYYCFFVFN